LPVVGDAGARYGAAVRRVALLSLVTALACSPAPPNETPEGAVREFVERMQGFAGDESDAKVLFDLLSQRARQNLEHRADRYGAASGKQIAPWAMIAPGRLAPRFLPRAYSSQIVGKYALVEVVGVSDDQRAQVPCVREEEAWRVDLVLPELPPIEKRPGTDLEP
jgi:hypothetical protein